MRHVKLEKFIKFTQHYTANKRQKWNLNLNEAQYSLEK